MSAEIDELERRLSEFSMFEGEIRGRVLPDHLTFIKRGLNPGELANYIESKNKLRGWDTYTPFAALLQKAVTDTVELKMIVDGEMLPAWEGGYTVVALNTVGGDVLGGLCNRKGAVYNEYKDSLYPFALSKALMGMHLLLSAKTQGIRNEENYRHLKDVGVSPIFMGDSWIGIFGGTTVQFGTSGCELDHAYRQLLVPEGLKPLLNADFVAGYGDDMFARQLSEMVGDFDVLGRNGNLVPKVSFKEPEFLSLLRRSH